MHVEVDFQSLLIACCVNKKIFGENSEFLELPTIKRENCKQKRKNKEGKKMVEKVVESGSLETS